MSATTDQPLSPWQHDARLRIAVSCFAVVVVLACGATPVLLTAAPAEDLQLSIRLTGAFTTDDLPVELRVTVQEPSKGGFVALTSAQRLTCEGVSDPSDEEHPWTSAVFVVPREPPGGAYTCVYTDERGQRTILTLPIPAGQFAFVSPAAGARMAIPQPPDEPTATAAATPVPSQPTPLSLVIHYTFPSPPGYTAPLADSTSTPAAQGPGPYATIFGEVGCGAPPPLPLRSQYANATSTAGAAPAPTGLACIPANGDLAAATGTYVMSGMHGVYYRFSGILTGPGWIHLEFQMRWSAPAGGFKSIQVDTRDDVSTPITWA
jgi:hypothetical protein